MSEPPNSPPPQPNDLKTKRASEVAISIGLFCCLALWLEPTWPVTVGVVGIAVSFAFVCLRILQ